MKATFYLLGILLCLNFSNVYSQCKAPTTSSPAPKCPGTTVTLTATTSGSTSTVTSHRWYTSSSGGSSITPTSSFSPYSGVWVSTMNISSSSNATYYVASVCSGVESARSVVSYTPASTSYLSISPSSSPTGVCSSSAGSFTLTATGGSGYQWRFGSPSNSVISTATTITPQSLIPNQSGTYYLTGTNSCGVSQTTSIPVVFVQALTSLTNISGPTSVATGSPNTYSVSANTSTVTYSWTRVSGNGNFSSPNNSSTQFTLTSPSALIKVIATGCNGSTMERTLTVSAISCTPPGANNPPSTCPGTTVALGATSVSSGVTSHRWYTASSGGSQVTPSTNYSPTSGVWISSLNVSSSSAATYYVAAVCSGVETARTMVTYTPASGASIVISPSGNPTNICLSSANSFSLTATGGSNYQWRFNSASGSVISTSTTIYPNQQFYGQSGYYYLTGTTSCGVTQTSQIPVFYSSGCRVSPEEEELQSGLNAYPNPAKDGTTVTYKLKSDSRVTLELMDNQGKKIESFLNDVKQTAGDHRQYIPSNQLQGSMHFYLIRLMVNNEVFTKKIILE